MTYVLSSALKVSPSGPIWHGFRQGRGRGRGARASVRSAGREILLGPLISHSDQSNC